LSDRKSANQSFKEDSMESYLSESASRTPETAKSIAPPPLQDPTESTLEDESTSYEVLENDDSKSHIPSPVQEVVKRLQASSPLSSLKVRKSFDIPELDVPVKAKASDYESGKLLLSSSPSASSDRVAQDLQQIIEEGMVMKKVETVELTEQQILCKQLALAAAAVANRRSAEEAARRAAIQAMEAAVERAAREEELRQEQERQRQEEIRLIQQQAEEELQRELRNRIAEAKAKAAQLQAESEERRVAAKQQQEELAAAVGGHTETTLDSVPASESFQSQRTYHTVPEFNEEDDEEDDEEDEMETCEVKETEVYHDDRSENESPLELQPECNEDPPKMQSPLKVVTEDTKAMPSSVEIVPKSLFETEKNPTTLEAVPKVDDKPPMNDASLKGNLQENEAACLKAEPDESPTVPTVTEDEEEEEVEEVIKEEHHKETPQVVLKHAPISGVTSDFLEEELHVEEDEPFLAHRSMDHMVTHMPPVAVIANSVSFDQRSYQDDVSNFSNDDSSALQQSGHNSSHKLFQKKSSQPSPRRSISDIIRHDLWNKDEAVVEHSLKLLAEKASIHGSYRNAIARAGGILAIVRAMEQNMNHVGTQIAACQALEKLALDTENELAIGEVGGVEAILSAMMAHYTNGSVQEAAWAALWNCTCGNACDTMTIDTTQGGMTAIVSCMKQHVENPIVQVSACNTLLNLCLDNTERLQALVEADGLVAISQAMQTHWKDPTVRNEACYVLSSLLEKNTKQHMTQQQQESVEAVEQYEEVEVFEEEFL
jgi:hypothetical protein